MERIEHLHKVYETYKHSESEIRAKIFSVEHGDYYFIPSFEGNAVVSAIYSIYIIKDSIKAKDYFFKAARVAEYMSVKFDTRIIDSGINQICYALLSDNWDLISRYSVLKNTINHELNIGYQLPNAVQNILLGELEKLEENIRNLQRFVKVARFKWWAPLINVLTGFLTKDQTLIEEGLNKMLVGHSKRNTDPLISRFISIDTAGLCKLAWLQGYQIHLNSDLVPADLMPIEPISIYENYDFLK